MTELKYTPTPFKTLFVKPVEARNWIIDDNENLIADLPGHAIDDAQFIVRACNVYDAAKALAQRAREINLRCLQRDLYVQYVEMQELVDLAEAFLAKAKEQTNA